MRTTVTPGLACIAALACIVLPAFGGEEPALPDRGLREAMELFERVRNDTNVSAGVRDAMNANRAAADALRLQNKKQGDLALGQLFGQHATRAAEAARLGATRFVNGVNSRLTVLHDARPESAASDTALGSLDLFNCPESEKIDRLWLGSNGAWTRQQDKDGVLGYKYDSLGVLMGYDLQRGDFSIGASGGFSRGRLRNNEDYTRTDVDALNLGVYASYDPVGGFFADANLGYGQSWNKARTYTITGGAEKTGRFDSFSLSAGGNIGYNFETDSGLTITPTLGVQWTRVHQNGWKESTDSASAVANWFDSGSNDYIDVPIAVRVSQSFQLSNGTVITPEARAAWIRSLGDDAATVRMGYAGSSDSAVLYGVDSGKSRGLVGAGVKANINATVDAFVDYNLEFRSGYKNNNLTAGMGVSF